MNDIKKLLKVKLKDDNTATGGVSHDEETLSEFLEVIEWDTNAKLDNINNELKANGILPINETNYPELYI